ncbi:MAG: hypothetical protein K6G91_06480 [Kiritimatiellae bacterium]|nr:hypothetical protein [Kiritimatiellia bacterium]
MKSACILAALLPAGGAGAEMSLAGRWHVEGDGFSAEAALPGTLAEAGLGARQSYETWKAITNIVEKGALRLSHVYRGRAVWSRTVVVPEEFAGRALEMFLERVLWTSKLTVDGRVVGSRDSLGTPHVYRFAPGELAPGAHSFAIEIDNSSHYCFSGNSHGWGWSTQTCWNGVIGRFELREANPLDAAQVFSPYPAKEVRVVFAGGDLDAKIDGVGLKGVREGANHRFALPFEPEPWSEASPRLYTLSLSSGGRRRDVRIGFRTIERRGNRLYLNGKQLWMRGDVDNCQFPLTGYPAMTPAEWRRQIRIQKENGVNAMRFHTWTPPDAAFQAADELGFYLFAETGYWADAEVPMNNIGRGNAELDDFCRRELFAVAETYGNHASFVGIGVGNELGKCDFGMMDGWMKELKARDGRRLTMVSTARQVAESDDLMVTHLYPGVGPVRCRFRPGTDWDYEDVYSKTPIPTIAHEIGQWPVYPLWIEIAKYDGLLRPFDWEAMRRAAEENGTIRFNREYHRASLKTNRFMYKDEVESYLRTPSCSGLQLLDMRDYTGQCEALVGWLDAFFDAKAGISELQPFSSVMRPVAFLARAEKFVLSADETFAAELLVRNVSEEAIPAGMMYPYSFAGRSGHVRLGAAVEPGGFSEPFRVSFRLDGSMTASRQELRFGENRWSVFVMDAAGAAPCDAAGVTVTARPETAAKALAEGGRVVYTGRSRGALHGRFVPVYWSSSYFPVYDPCAMLGTWFDEDHPAFSKFPTEDWMDRQWRTLTEAALVHEAKGLGDGFRPIAMPVPDIHLSRPYATLFEVRVGKGRLIVCGYPIDRSDSIEARQLRRSVLGYAASEAFRPETEASPEWFASFACEKRPEDIDKGDWREARREDGSVVLTIANPPRSAGEYAVLFGEDCVLSATCEGRPCETMSAMPIAMATGSVGAADVADGRVEFVFSAADSEIPSVASVSFTAAPESRKP